MKDKIFDSSNQKVLKLCEENIAWCSSKSVNEIKNTKVIENGYLMSPSKSLLKVLLKRKEKRESIIDSKELVERV